MIRKLWLLAVGIAMVVAYAAVSSLAVQHPSRLKGGRTDIREFGGNPDAPDNTAAYNAAARYTQRFGGSIFFPSGFTWRFAGRDAGAAPFGACLTVYDGEMIEGDRIGGVGRGGIATAPSVIKCDGDVDGISQTGRVDNVVLRNITIEGSATTSQSTRPTAGIHAAYSTGWRLDNVTVKNFVDCFVFDTADGGAGQGLVTAPICSQQAGYPNARNWYPRFGIWAHGSRGQLQALNVFGGALYAMQIARSFDFTGDGTTNEFLVDLSSLWGARTRYYLWAADGLKVTVGGDRKALQKDYRLIDVSENATPIYGADGDAQLQRDSFTVEMQNVAGLPRKIACSQDFASPCVPLLSVSGLGIPPDSYVTRIDGSTLTFTNPEHLPARVGGREKITVAELNIAGQPGCHLSRATPVRSHCGYRIKVRLKKAPYRHEPIRITWADPWGAAGVYFDGDAASNNFIEGLAISSYRDAILDTAKKGRNLLWLSYVQIVNRCAEIWASEDDVRCTASSPSTVAENPGAPISSQSRVRLDTHIVRPIAQRP